MSESDSFIEEVSEEVRRDRLFGYLRRYGWIGATAVVLIVGGAAFNEYRKAQARAQAEALGDALLSALESDAPEARLDALDDVAAQSAAETPAGDVVALLRAAEHLSASDPAAAAEALRPLAQDPDAPPVYSDLAALKLVLIGEAALDAQTRAQLLERLARPGAPYAQLAREQQILDLAASGEADAAVEQALALLQEQGLTQGLQARLVQLIVALGGSLPQGEAG